MVHLEAALVSDGDQVAPGTVLGPKGSTGFGVPTTGRYSISPRAA
jgi:murein DD-endopeptidase MepM/ murein hydrolase activator NlpD